MKVIFDYQIFGLQNYGGISRYFVNLMKGLSENNIENELIIKFSNNSYLHQEYSGLATKYKEFSFFRRSKNIVLFKSGLYLKFFQKYFANILNKIFTVKKLNKVDGYIFHPTYYDPYFLKFIGNNPFILTIYDMIHETFPDHIDSGFPITKWKKKLVNKADVIIAISENTKKDIANIYRVDPKNISVIYLGNSLNRWDGRKRLNLPEKYILYVGHRWVYKNFNEFIKAVFKLLEEKDLRVVCAGGNKFFPDEVKLIKKLKINDRVIYQPIKNDKELSECYARAELFSYPSRYEGFGMPILEAFANACPVVASNTSSFPEVAKDAAIYFDPNDEKSIETAVKKVLNNKKLKERLIKAGSKRLRDFSWDKTAKETAKVYKDVLRFQKDE